MYMIDLAFAMGTGGTGGSGGGGLGAFLPLIIIFAIFYFLLISSGGLHGVITGMSDDVLTVEISPKIRVKISRGSIAGVIRRAEGEVRE
jgi:preprotein translocase subunit YajC